MTREEAIDHINSFDKELDELCKKYGVSARTFFGFIDTNEQRNGYPVCIYADSLKGCANEEPAKIVQLIFKGGVGIIRAFHSKPLIHEYYSGFGKQKPFD